MTGTAAEACYDALLAAARGRTDPTPAWSAARLAEADGRTRLGWLCPPPWSTIEDRLARSGFPDGAPGRVVFIGTGGWAFGARAALAGGVPGGAAAGPGRVRVVDRLDRASVDALTRGGAGEPPTVVSVSESGRTFETRMLTSLARQGPPGSRIIELGEARTPGGLSLDADGAVNALFGAPVSLPFAWAAASGGIERYAAAHRAFADGADGIGRRAAAAASDIATSADQRIAVAVPGSLDEGTRLWILQALRQGLCGKSAPGLWIDVIASESCERSDGGNGVLGRGTIRVELAERLGLARIRPADPVGALSWTMALLYGSAVFTAVVGIRKLITFAEHPAVGHYKRLLGARYRGPDSVVRGDQVERAAVAWAAAAPGLAGVHLVRYDTPPEALEPALPAGAAGRTWEVHDGSRWNHHSYQALHGHGELGLVAVVPPAGSGPGAWDLGPAQRAVAEATCASLPGRALLLIVHGSPADREAPGQETREKEEP
jgi:hypothetical protein